ncbi:hypothetical protein GLOIN_2v1881393 [Rhizophagus irregularis DAOM 181602=DAOM 197198]|uniref:Uncharacterized protein n=3 Tax=Rhizophagus irregularis TaxID=588596 RepID=A0A015LVT4_RHIIW|nr:hypothetical protein RirG_029670 [Rhizophagus irregularis DAOM 197198w]GBC37974.1 hypothetical protein GLOIN_2v1881393 [Rhizophagus irregularis DAOM 181602=DAOM 197198]
MESAYKFTEYRYRFLKETKNIFSADSRTTAKSQERVPKDGGLSKTEQNFLESIRNDAVRRKETIKDIVLKCSATSFDVYIDEIKRLSWENSKLREELRKKDHVMDRKVNEEKQQARIISQKNEQIRKISQEVEKTRSELKKVKTGVNKEVDQLKKSKKGRSTSNRRKWEEIVEIPVLPENISNDQQAKEARDIFFYDIPKYWSEDDVRTNLMKIGTVYRLQIRGQYKYKTVKAKIALNENFEKTFLEGHFGICISKNFIRWYDAKLGLKGRQERDQWQTVRDLTNEEMESIKKGNTYDFTKKLQQTFKTAFIKIIKITKNWKVIGYFKNLKEMEEAVEDSCTQGDINRVWLVRNKKTIYKDGDAKTRAKKLQEKIVQEKVIATENRTRSPSRLDSEPKTPITPPERIYRELGNFASRKESLLHPSKEEKPVRISKTPDENEVVEMIKNWRVGEENTQDHNDTSENKRKQLKKDNVVPEEVVDIIKDYRTMNKIKYVQYQESDHNDSLVDKLMEVKDVFDQTSNEMEWERINTEALYAVSMENSIDSLSRAKEWALEKNNFFLLGQKIISLAEKSKIFQEYTTLNDNFKQRLENENRYQDEKKTGEKRPILESPSKWSDLEDGEEKNKAFTAMHKERRQREQLISFLPAAIYGIEEDLEEEEEEEEVVEPEASPSKKKGGKKKKKKKNSKK